MASRPRTVTDSLDALDRRVVALLQRDARMRTVRIATALKVPESTARKRLARLIDRGIIQFAAVMDPLRLGFRVWAIFEITTDLDRIDEVARRVAEAPETFFVGMTTGTTDVYATAVFRDNEHLHEFKTKRLARIHGIRTVRTSTIMRVVKRRVTYGLPEVPSSESGRQGARTGRARSSVRVPAKPSSQIGPS